MNAREFGLTTHKIWALINAQFPQDAHKIYVISALFLSGSL